jgi:hypothetical protein
MVSMITCETPGMMWTVEGKIESLDGTYGGDGAHIGIDDLSRLLSEHVDRWAKVRVELIEGPRPLPYRSRTGKLIDYEPSPSPNPLSPTVKAVQRMRSLATNIRERIATLRAKRGTERYVTPIEEQCIETLAETMLVICDEIEAFDRRLKSLETEGAR